MLEYLVPSVKIDTPVDKTMEIIRRKLESDKKLTADDLMELVEFVLTTTYFTSKQIINQQKKGVAMSSTLSPVRSGEPLYGVARRKSYRHSLRWHMDKFGILSRRKDVISQLYTWKSLVYFRAEKM